MENEGTKAKQETEFFEEFITSRNDTLYDAAYQLLKLLAAEDVRKDPTLAERLTGMEFTAELVDTAATLLKEKGVAVCYPYFSGDEEIPCYRAGDCESQSNHFSCPLRKNN